MVPTLGMEPRVKMVSSAAVSIGTSGHLDTSLSTSLEEALERESARTSANPNKMRECKSASNLSTVEKVRKRKH